MTWHVADANSYLVITGGGIESVKIVKKALVLPWQRYSTISISPFDLEIALQAMTIEKLQVGRRPPNGSMNAVSDLCSSVYPPSSPSVRMTLRNH